MIILGAIIFAIGWFWLLLAACGWDWKYVFGSHALIALMVGGVLIIAWGVQH